MNFELTKEQESISNSAVDFAKKALEPIAYEDDRSARYPKEVVDEMASKGYLGMLISKDYGGGDIGMANMAALLIGLGKYYASVAAILSSHAVAAAQTIEKYGTVDQKKAYLPHMVSGELLGGYAFAEPNAALASGDDKAIAAKDGNDYKLTGKKTFVSNGDEAGVYVVIAQTDEEMGPKGISAFIVEKSEIKESRNIDKLGRRSFPTTEITLAGAKASLLGGLNEGQAIIADVSARMDIANGAMASGIASALVEDSVEYTKTRIQFGAPLAKIQAVQWMLAAMDGDRHLMEMLVYAAADRYDKGGDYIKEAAYLKLFSMHASQEIGMNGVQVHGGKGYSREEKVERYFRDIRGAYHIENANDYPQKVIVSALIK